MCGKKLLFYLIMKHFKLWKKMRIKRSFLFVIAANTNCDRVAQITYTTWKKSQSFVIQDKKFSVSKTLILSHKIITIVTGYWLWTERWKCMILFKFFWFKIIHSCFHHFFLSKTFLRTSLELKNERLVLM